MSSEREKERKEKDKLEEETVEENRYKIELETRIIIRYITNDENTE